jgi:hypothetical protein
VLGKTFGDARGERFALADEIMLDSACRLDASPPSGHAAAA